MSRHGLSSTNDMLSHEFCDLRCRWECDCETFVDQKLGVTKYESLD
jgi:hypothetical protein